NPPTGGDETPPTGGDETPPTGGGETPPTPTNPPVEKKGSVVVKYKVLSSNGTVDTTIDIPDYQDTPLTTVGKSYNTAETETEKPKSVTVNGKVYEYVRVEGSENGNVVEGETV
ncbi:TPA: hypothetical protein ACGO4K_002231, partial [Streptococcus suis]